MRLNGEKLNGVWALIPAHFDGKEKNWLIVRKREDTAAAPQRRYAPMLATLEREVPRGDGWAFEVKWDGYRALAYVRDGECTLTSRNDKPLTERFPQIAKEIVKAVRTPNAVLDGEVCALDEQGRSSFSEMQKGSNMLVYYAFDVLEVDGVPLVDLAFTERHERLQRLLDKRNRVVRVSETFNEGEALLEAAREQKLEGIMAKRLDSRYLPGKRTRDWLKVKTHGREKFVVAGYTHGGGRRARDARLADPRHARGGELRYVGNVGTGFTDKEIRSLMAKLKPLRRRHVSVHGRPKMPRVRKDEIVWAEPKLVAEVEFAEVHARRAAAGAVIRGPARGQGAAEEVHREEPLHDVVRAAGACWKLSNLDKVFWPGEEHHEGRPPSLLPADRGRPRPAPRGPAVHDEALPERHYWAKFFFQKGCALAHAGLDSHVPRPRVHTRKPRRRKWVNFPLVNDELALLWMVNMGCVDLNTWYSRVDKPDRPDFVLFDLDPAQGAGFPETVQVAARKAGARRARARVVPEDERLRRHTCSCLSSAGTRTTTRASSRRSSPAALAPHAPQVGDDRVDEVEAARCADRLEPERRGKTIASVYSVRPHPGAPVSTPLRGTR